MNPTFTRAGLALSLAAALSACGAWQYVKDTTVELGGALLFTRITTLKLDLNAREALNPDDKERPLSVVVRVYQLKDGKSFQAATYQQLLSDDKALLGDDLLARKEVVLMPGASVSLTEPMDPTTSQIGVVALFRNTGKDGGWRLGLPKDVLDNDKPARLELRNNQIVATYLPQQPKAKAADNPTLPEAPALTAPVAAGNAPVKTSTDTLKSAADALKAGKPAPALPKKAN